MIWVKNNKIYMYEGDTGEFPVFLSGDIQEGDILQFRIKENLDDATTLYYHNYNADEQVNIEIDSTTSALLVNDLATDKTLKYGFKLKRNNDTDTILGVGDFILKKGV